MSRRSTAGRRFVAAVSREGRTAHACTARTCRLNAIKTAEVTGHKILLKPEKSKPSSMHLSYFLLPRFIS